MDSKYSTPIYLKGRDAGESICDVRAHGPSEFEIDERVVDVRSSSSSPTSPTPLHTHNDDPPLAQTRGTLTTVAASPSLDDDHLRAHSRAARAPQSPGRFRSPPPSPSHRHPLAVPCPRHRNFTAPRDDPPPPRPRLRPPTRSSSSAPTPSPAPGVAALDTARRVPRARAHHRDGRSNPPTHQTHLGERDNARNDAARRLPPPRRCTVHAHDDAPPLAFPRGVFFFLSFSFRLPHTPKPPARSRNPPQSPPPTALATPRHRHVTAPRDDTHLHAHPLLLILPTTHALRCRRRREGRHRAPRADPPNPVATAAKSAPCPLKRGEHDDAGPMATRTAQRRRGVPDSQETRGRTRQEGTGSGRRGHSSERRAPCPSFDVFIAGRESAGAAGRQDGGRDRARVANEPGPVLALAPTYAVPRAPSTALPVPTSSRARPSAHRPPRSPSPALPVPLAPAHASAIPRAPRPRELPRPPPSPATAFPFPDSAYSRFAGV
ncbi:hypothetical protein PLICRDRAFT_180662 [Plicaturopsis crispa FD-325 SS-3]|uniref:Uncharacterized protein n=1 Tax=Plicaturopsis crispa FD-325 SS-3 TaxID=944288 RepID=A0A0C9SPZ8_PLICR|nr:hypothetical protein PLICRDRAFT_180662 [Plicaturopsis crispa FD-325 SS-3]